MSLIPLNEVFELVTEVFVNSKTSKKNSKVVARALVKAECDGLLSHGLARVSSYTEQSISGKVNGFSEPIFRQTAESTAQIDAAGGFSYPAINLGLEWAKEQAGVKGIVGVGISNSHHAGVLGHHVEKIAEHGLIGLAFTNSPSALLTPKN